MRTFESIDRNAFKAATYVEYNRLVCALNNVIWAIVNAVQGPRCASCRMKTWSVFMMLFGTCETAVSCRKTG